MEPESETAKEISPENQEEETNRVEKQSNDTAKEGETKSVVSKNGEPKREEAKSLVSEAAKEKGKPDTNSGQTPNTKPQPKPSSEGKPLTVEGVKKEQAAILEKYLESSGLSLSFEIIFREILTKKIPEDQVFAYAALRLRQIEEELSKLPPMQT